MSGDEPLQIARKFPGAIVAVDADRRRGIEILEERFGPDLILLDDGFQHRRVKPWRSILLTAYDELYPGEPYLPAGNLRDHRSQAGRADLVVVTKCPQSLSGAERTRIRGLLKLKPGQQLAFSYLCYQDAVDLQGKPIPWETLSARALTVVTGIARPEPMLEYLKRKGIRFEHLKFGDHHRFNKAELEQLKGRGPILTTEKDAVRLEGELDALWVLPVQHCFSPADREVMLGFLSQF
jgi:tetraacyldisaccharide 4'-kinase